MLRFLAELRRSSLDGEVRSVDVPSRRVLASVARARAPAASPQAVIAAIGGSPPLAARSGNMTTNG
jgi:hypothetical protein